MLRAIPESEKKNWKAHLPKLMFAYNSTVNKTTGFSPFYLLFGRDSLLPIDCMLPLEPKRLNQKTYNEFVKDWKASMKEAYQVVYQQMEKVGNYNKQYYDSKIKTVDIEVGDHVLVRNIDKDPGGKIKSHWEQRIWLVTAKEDNIPVYTIKLLNGSRVKKVHRNLLMKVNNLPLETFGQQPKPRRRPQAPAPNASNGDPVPQTNISQLPNQPVLPPSSPMDDGSSSVVPCTSRSV